MRAGLDCVHTVVYGSITLKHCPDVPVFVRTLVWVCVCVQYTLTSWKETGSCPWIFICSWMACRTKLLWNIEKIQRVWRCFCNMCKLIYIPKKSKKTKQNKEATFWLIWSGARMRNWWWRLRNKCRWGILSLGRVGVMRVLQIPWRNSWVRRR